MSVGASETIEARLRGRLGDFELDADFNTPASGVTLLVGPSASGKTTLLRCLAGLSRLEGVVRFRGTVWQDQGRFVPPHRRPIGYVFQEPSLFPHLTVRGNLAYGLKRRHGPLRLAFDAAVELLGLAPLLDRSPAKLSGGERQRVAIGRALLSQPELLLMDEPVSSLDPEGKAEVMGRLESVGQALATPVIYVSHDPAEAARLADRVVMMRQGRIVSSRETPADAAAAHGAALDQMSPDAVRRLALAALAAGLEPSPPPGSRGRP